VPAVGSVDVPSGANSVRPLSRAPALFDRLQNFNQRRSEHERRRRRIASQQQQQQRRRSRPATMNKRLRLDDRTQVEMAPLPLKLQSCDGGSYGGDSIRSYSYPGGECSPANALRDDSSGSESTCPHLSEFSQSGQLPTGD
jgi:hypothetical protein